MDYFRPASARGRADFGWLRSAHSFSFGRYYDPQHMGFSVLRVINDDWVAPASGFDTHPHRDMEIISYITGGTIEHRDSMGNAYQIPAGDIQVMSAGTGITHSEYNASKQDPLTFLQIWITPAVNSVTPSYAQQAVSDQPGLVWLVSPTGENGTLKINQDARIARIAPNDAQPIELNTAQRFGYLHVVRGSIQVNGQLLTTGDGAGYVQDRAVTLTFAEQDAEALWFDLPAID